MDSDEVIAYKQQLLQVNQALHSCTEGAEKDELLILKANIEELLSLTNENEGENSAIPPTSSKDPLSDEFALFMAEMEKEGAVERKSNEKIDDKNLDDFKDIEGLKCRAPHTHLWGHVAYHNAMICSVVPESITDPDGIKVRVLFMNPTHREMLPCPYYYESDCKFSEERCDYSHGEVVWYSSLQEYIEPQFDLLVKGSFVLVKQPDNLWCRAVVKEVSIEKCLVRLESSKKELEVTLEHIFPLNEEINESECSSSDDDNNTKLDEEYVINTSLLLQPSDEILGAWEQYTKGIGSKLMQKMGYVVGTGLGKDCAGRVEPVTAVILPKGKSLDHCMQLREQAGGDKNFFSAEKRRKKQQKKRKGKIQNETKQKKKKKTDMFNFLNKVIARNNNKREKDELEEKKKIKMQCSRNLNIRNLLVADNIRRAEKDMEKLKEVVGNYPPDNSNLYLKLKDKLVNRQDLLKMYKTEALMIRNELRYRENERKLTIF